MNKFYVFFCIVPFLLTSCAQTEKVMVPGMIIEAENRNGLIRIEAGKGNRRAYEWTDPDGQLRNYKAKLWRRNTRWHGSLGISSPGGRRPVHALLEEAQQHFFSKREALEWLRWRNERYDWVYTSDGLVVGWYDLKVGETQTSYQLALWVEVTQLYINGLKPDHLPGAADDRIRVQIPDAEKVNLPSAGQFIPSRPQIINGREYSGKALDNMRDHRISFKTVENALNYPIKEEDDWLFFHRKCVVITDRAGRVVLVYR